jgi:hypothetical protein
MAMWPLLLRIDARRPASWIGLALACAAGAAAGPLEAMAVAALAAVAAAGDTPRPCPGPVSSQWLAERMAWAGAGMLGGAAVRWLVMGGVGGEVIVPSCAVVIATGIVLQRARAEEMPAADAASLALVAATASFLAGAAAGSVAVALATWGVAAATMVLWLRVVGASPAPLPRGGDLVGGLVSRTPIRRGLGRVAMLTMLAAMAAWLLLDPERSGWAVWLGVAWIVSLAAPVALLPAAEDPRASIETVVRHAAVLSWPAVVAAGMAGGQPGGAFPALVVTAGIAVASATILVLGLACRALRVSRESAFAVALAGVAVFVHLFPVATVHGVGAFVSAADRPPG